jgi:zinc D-Ala-D-Ala carboxypeptidase
MPKLTEHFSLEEMTFSKTAVRHGLDNRPNTRIIQNLTELCEELLEPIRELAGGPINVSPDSVLLQSTAWSVDH